MKYEIYQPALPEGEKPVKLGLIHRGQGEVDLCVVNAEGRAIVYLVGLTLDGKLLRYASIPEHYGFTLTAEGEIEVFREDDDE